MSGLKRGAEIFNLLIQYGGWDPRRSTVGRGRFLEYTEESVKERIINNGAIDFNFLMSIPTIFVAEQDTGDGLARVGRITAAREIGREIAIEYLFDTEIQPFSEDIIFGNPQLFSLAGFQASRSHWSCKNDDFYKILYTLRPPDRFQPTVFRLNNPQRVENDLVSLMMPFSREFAPVHEAINRLVVSQGKRCQRVDEVWNHDAIYQDIVDLIDRSSVVVCDCSGRNPNVFYEMGIAHTLGKRVILITQNNNDVPFDVRHLRYIAYLNNGEGLRDLTDQLSPILS